MKKFKVGDLVKIKKTSGYYSNNPTNPKEVLGVIDELKNGDYYHLPIAVDWFNDANNVYAASDLELVNEEELINYLSNELLKNININTNNQYGDY